MITPEILLAVEDKHREAFARYESARIARAQTFAQAIAEGWTYQRIQDATGLSRQRAHGIVKAL